MTDIYEAPLLTAREAARTLKMPESTLDSWLADGSRPSLVHAVRPERRGWPRVPFVGVVEAYVLRTLRELGFSMPDIRRAADLVRSEFQDPYALARERIATDGVGLFVRVADQSVIHARDDQIAFPEVIAEYLTYISWDAEGNPARLRLPQYPAGAEVVIDPSFGWGAPVLAKSKVPVEALVSLWRTGEPISVVAEEYDLPADVVEDVLRQAA
ncbi:DUF433 domain-containing protein [Kribbella sp. NPDC059898]|uniref:DUF433 domain-containing protein n=1 Tax=Kribbella sp. NPDC059898 TaxID=3346995 RepID=UPI00364E9EB8